MTKKLYFLTGLLLCCMLTNATPLKKNNGDQISFTLNSPDKKLLMKFSVTKGGTVSYTFSGDKKELIGESELGLEGIGSVEFVESKKKSVDEVWVPVWGKRTKVRDHYNELTLNLKSYVLIARAYNDGVAFRYKVNSGIPTSELTQFNFADDYTAWFYNGENPNLGPDKLTLVDGKRLPVMTIKVNDNSYMAIHEACLTSGEPLVLQSKSNEKLFSVASKPNDAWRVIFFGRKPGNMVDSHLIELLNPDPENGLDFSWVKPGVAVWDWRINGAVAGDYKYTMSLQSWKRMVDFASENNMKHLVLDADWYGPEFGQNSDPIKGGKVEQVHEIIKYGKEKGVGIWLYLNDVGGRNFPLEQTLEQYGSWGAAGVKYGFMQGNPVEKNERTRLITRLCAKNHLLCDFHDGPVHPNGQMRTWPNAITREYCHAQLDGRHVFSPKTFTTSVFVNMLSGPLDMNNGLADLTQAGRVDYASAVPSTLTAEIARTLIVFSGATIIPDIPENYQKHPELLQFLASEKMPWKESITLSGEIGEHIVMARQAADGNWLVGAATNEQSRELDIPLSFLGRGKYEALIIQDGDDSDYRTHKESYKSSKQIVNKTNSIHVKLAPGGGSCILLSKVKDE